MTQQPRFQLTPEQYERLTMPLDTNRVGKNPKGYSHLEAWDVRRWLIRVFGFGSFDIETIELAVVREIEIPPSSQGGKSRWTVVYRAQVRLTVYDQFGGKVVLEDGACGDSTNQPALGDCHDNASKTALSQALKRCAVNLGDCFGLSLYNGGGAAPVVLRSLVAPVAEASPAAAELPAEDAPVRPEPGTEPTVAEEHHQEPAAEPAERPVSGPPANRPVSGPPAALSAAATGLLDDLTEAADETGLRRVWRAAGEAANDGRISAAEAEHIQRQWKVRKEQLIPSNPATEPQHKKIHALCKEAGLDDRDTRLLFISDVLGRDIDTQRRLSVDDAKKVIDRLEAAAVQNNPPAEQEGQAA